jgi:hypothetical protein
MVCRTTMDFGPGRHNYVKRLRQLHAEGKLDLSPGEVAGLLTLHDDWCALLVTGGYCDCNPEFRLVRGGKVVVL